MMYYAVIDTNVLISAMLKNNSVPGTVVAEALRGDIIPLINDEIPDKDDAVFYAVLMEKRKDADAYLVTGNMKHFPVRTYIVTPKEMLNIIADGR